MLQYVLVGITENSIREYHYLKDLHMNEGQKKRETWLYIQMAIFFVVLNITFILWGSYDWISIPPRHTHMSPAHEELTYSICPTIEVGRHLNEEDEINYTDVVYYDYKSKYKTDIGEVMFFSRIVGLPGDTIAFDKGKLIRNGAIVQETYISIDNIGEESFPEIIIPTDHVYILNDNRRLIGREVFYRDSRYVGPVSMFVLKGMLGK